MRAWRVAWVCLAACAPIEGPPRAPAPDAAFVRACDEDACACGGEAMACCETRPPCAGPLRCIDGTCHRAGARCVLRGIFQAGFLAAEFIAFAGPGVRRCSEIPRELFDPSTPGTFLAPAPEVGALECEGLAPGDHTLRLRARLRALPQHHTTEVCWCTGLSSATLSVTQVGGATWTIVRHLQHPEGQVDEQCNRGPDIDWTQRVTVGSDGHLSVLVDLAGCLNDGEPRCLFLRGASLTLDEGAP